MVCRQLIALFLLEALHSLGEGQKCALHQVITVKPMQPPQALIAPGQPLQQAPVLLPERGYKLIFPGLDTRRHFLIHLRRCSLLWYNRTVKSRLPPQWGGGFFF